MIAIIEIIGSNGTAVRVEEKRDIVICLEVEVKVEIVVIGANRCGVVLQDTKERPFRALHLMSFVGVTVIGMAQSMPFGLV